MADGALLDRWTIGGGLRADSVKRDSFGAHITVVHIHPHTIPYNMQP